MPDNAAANADRHTWKPLRLLTFYRLILSGLLTLLYYALGSVNPFGVTDHPLFATTLLAWLGFSLLVGFSTRLHWPGYRFQAVVQIALDIIAISLLMYASGGINSGLSVLIIISVATGALLLPARLAFLFPAIASLILLVETGYGQLAQQHPGVDMITRAGLLGMVLFAATGLAYVLARRVRESEALAVQRGLDLANLEQLNQHVIQHLQSGVLVIDPDGRIRMSNTTARQLLGMRGNGKTLQKASPELAQQLQLWQQDHSWQPETIKTTAAENSLIPRFSDIKTAQGTGAIIFLDDSTTLARQSQQIKLASLGRLSASIAHEIRNPLGAISHAAQLLDESDKVDAEDKRLIEIIGNHSQRVNTIIENILQLSRQKPLQPQQLPVSTWLDQLATEFCMAENISRTQVEVRVQPENLLIHTDPDILHQVLWNLLQNAIRHAGDPPRVALEVRQPEQQPLTLDIIDNGPGIADELVDKVFEPFFTTKSGGTGLGLYLARELCERNHSHLSYHKDVQGPSYFRIHFAPQTA